MRYAAVSFNEGNTCGAVIYREIYYNPSYRNSIKPFIGVYEVIDNSVSIQGDIYKYYSDTEKCTFYL